jgi:hypothetical protein
VVVSFLNDVEYGTHIDQAVKLEPKENRWDVIV